MSYEHNRMAHEATKTLLTELRTGNATWTIAERLTQNVIFWQGVSDWPHPDNAFQDSTTASSFAIEFKPPGHGKNEYVRGLGQAITYLQNFEFSALVVPKHAVDGYNIGDFLAALLQMPTLKELPIALFVYDKDPKSLQPLINLEPRLGEKPNVPKRTKKVFWAYWRDLSQYDLYEILLIMDRKGLGFVKAFTEFWKRFRTRGKAKTWEEKFRKKSSTTTPFFKSEKINVELSLRHVGLVDSQGHLIDEGYRLARHGKIYGPDSVSFRMLLGRYILTNGRHLELIFWVDEQQKQIEPTKIDSAQNFYHALDECLQEAGIIPRAPVGRAKATFLRDEQKLWNKLGLLVSNRDGRSYFYRGEGFRFDWRTIVSIVNYEL